METGLGSTSGQRAVRGRCWLVWLSSTLVLLLVLAWLRPDLPLAGQPRLGTTAAGPAGPSFEMFLVRACALAAGLACVWLWVLTTVVAVLAAQGRGRSRVPGLPRLWRHLVLTACGVALVGTGSAAVAAPDGTPAHDGSVLAGLPYPDRTGPDRTGPDRTGPDRTGCPAEGLLVVRAGDTLWELARRQLAPGADHAAITRAWHRLYARNRAVIGADPDLIHPHLRLRVPCR